MITVIPGFWSAPRCRDAITAAEQRGLVSAAPDYPPRYRDNDRQVFDDEALAVGVFDQLAAHLAAVVTTTGSPASRSTATCCVRWPRTVRAGPGGSTVAR